MSSFIVIGRILFVVLFVVSGAFKLIDIPGTAQMIAAKAMIPAQLTPYVTQIEAATGLTSAHLLAIVAGVLEIICGVMIGFDLGARWFAVILAIYVAITTYYFHDFWNMAGAERFTMMFEALKNVSLIGALVMLVGLPPARPATTLGDIYSDR